MKINFTAIKCKPTRKGEEVPLNFAENLGELIYQSGQTRKDKKLADLVGDSTGEIEITETEVKTIVDYVKRSTLPFWAKEGVLKALGEKEED